MKKQHAYRTIVTLATTAVVGLLAQEASAATLNDLLGNLISNVNNLPAAATAVGFIAGSAGSVASGWKLYEATHGNGGEIGDKAKYGGALLLSGLLMAGSVAAGASQGTWGSTAAPTYTKVTGPTITN